MSWPLASFGLVTSVLLVGWLAYERSRPSAKMVAVVGTLSGLAALGRDAFVAIPDVKPITAMTFVVGYALGPLPGFTVGAVGMLASNILLGEGSYTPWQMAAWGMVGLAGAGLGALTARHAGRLTIALGCALSALVAKEVMNVYEWTLGASHSTAALLLTVSKGLPFDVTDTLASLLFGLAFGPQLARLLARMRLRMSVTWEPAAAPLAALALALTLASALAPVAYAGEEPEVSFLLAAQNTDGGYGGAAGQRSSELYSSWTALGLAAAGIDPARVRRAGRSILDSIRAQAGTLQGAGDLERTILALHACGAAPSLPDVGDLATALLRFRSPDGSFGGLVNITSFAVLSLRAAGRPADDPVVRGALSWLRAQQNANGSFSYAARGGAGDVDDTGAAIQALVAAGSSGRAAIDRLAIDHAASYLLGAVNRDGGLPQQPGGESNAQSTAWAVQGLIAAGERPTAVPRGAVRSPLAYLESLRMTDGSVRYSRAVVQTPVWVTAQALTALAGKPLPVAPAHGLPPSAQASVAHRGAPARSVHLAAANRPVVPKAVSSHARRASSAAVSLVATGALTQARVDALARAAGELLAVVLD